MSRIRLLSEQVANQIAAGEVVDRPAAVVKELAENSLDAGAAHVAVEIEGGGAGLIRVADDGCGMDRDDVLLCLERHATSKLREASELEAIKSLGFRGEAIPSIASVSWLTILSRQKDAPLGARAEVRHGVLKEMREEGCARGTVMEARQLFANMPARKKFLKSGRTELFHMEEAVKNLALAHPQVAFSFRVEGRSVLNCPTGESMEERMRRIFRWKEDLLAVDAEAGGMRLSGFLLPPEKTAATSAKLRLFVNGRAVSDNMLRFAARDALQGHILRGCQPAGMLALTLPPGEVDVNVHPAKREIRFKNAEAARRLVAVAIVEALSRQERDLRESVFTPAGFDAPPTRPHYYNTGGLPGGGAGRPLPLGGGYSSAPTMPVRPPMPPPPDFGLAERGAQYRAPAAEPESAPLEIAPLGEFAGLRLIGQLFSLYLLCERQGRFVVIDQHAAHERILYTRMAQHWLEGGVPGQVLLFPESVDLEPALHELLEARQEEVAALGFGVQHFGDATWLIQQVPALCAGLDATALLREILEGLRFAPRPGKGEKANRDDFDDRLPPALSDLLAGMACKAAIKGGRRLEPQEMLDLLARMAASPVFSRCPHGRPVIKIFSEYEVEQWFRRTG